MAGMPKRADMVFSSEMNRTPVDICPDPRVETNPSLADGYLFGCRARSVVAGRVLGSAEARRQGAFQSSAKTDREEPFARACGRLGLHDIRRGKSFKGCLYEILFAVQVTHNLI